MARYNQEYFRKLERQRIAKKRARGLACPACGNTSANMDGYEINCGSFYCIYHTREGLLHLDVDHEKEVYVENEVGEEDKWLVGFHIYSDVVEISWAQNVNTGQIMDESEFREYYPGDIDEELLVQVADDYDPDYEEDHHDYYGGPPSRRKYWHRRG